MNADDRLNGETVDLRPLLGLLHDVPTALIERLTINALREHRELVARAEELFKALQANTNADEDLNSDAHLRYFEATIAMHAQMSALSTLLKILGYIPKA